MYASIKGSLIDKPLKKFIHIINNLNEEPVNNVAGGQIAGANEDPPVNKKKKKKNIYLGMGSRVQWLRNLKKK